MRVRSQYNIANNQAKCDPVALQNKMDDILADADSTIRALENLKGVVANRKVDSSKEKIALIVDMQNQLRGRFDRNKIARDRSIVANTQKTLSLMPSIIDYIVRVGIRSTVTQWSDALTRNTVFREEIPTKTNSAIDALFEATNRLYAGDISG